MEPIKFSVCIPSFHSRDRIENAVLSIVNGGYENYEILICDQADTDSSFLLEKYDRIRIKHLAEPSTYNARCELVKMVEGDYFLWLDDDDVFVTGSLSYLSSAILLSGELDVYMFDKAEREMTPVPICDSGIVAITNKSAFVQECLARKNGHFNDVVSKCFKKNPSFSYEPKNLFNNEDGYLLLELLDVCQSFGFLNATLYWPSSRPGSVSKGSSSRKIANMCEYSVFLFHKEGKATAAPYFLKTIEEAHIYLFLQSKNNGLSKESWLAFKSDPYVRSFLLVLRKHVFFFIKHLKSKYVPLFAFHQRWAYRFIFANVTRYKSA